MTEFSGLILLSILSNIVIHVAQISSYFSIEVKIFFRKYKKISRNYSISEKLNVKVIIRIFHSFIHSFR